MKTQVSVETIERYIEYLPESGLFRRKLFVRPGKDLVRGRVDHRGYLRVCTAGHEYLAHRLAWFLHHREWPAEEVDHINGNRQDNRICNLRESSHTQNNHNQPMRRNNKSGVKGVHRSRGGKWHVQVCLNYKIHHGGLYERLEDAEVAARQLRDQLHGEFANHG